MKSESIAELVEETCQLARGPARPVMDEGVKDWLESEARAIRQSLDLGHRYLPPPRWPLNEQNKDFPTACAVLGVLHDKECNWCVLFPEPKSGTVYHLAWELYRKQVEDLGPRYMRRVLDFVRSELQDRGVLPAGEDETPTTVPTKPPDRAEQGEVTGTGRQEATENVDQVTLLNELNSQTPELDDGSEDWVSSQTMARLLGVLTSQLRKRREKGVKGTDGTYGVHNRYLFWRKRGNDNPCYYLPLAKKHTRHLAKIYPPKSPLFGKKSP